MFRSEKTRNVEPWNIERSLSSTRFVGSPGYQTYELIFHASKQIRATGVKRNTSEAINMNEFLLLAVVMLYVAVSYRPGSPKTRRR